MATTTPNFGWSVPTSSDLVKNGATAIETLGDSIDASLVDLKGGTTGQVLAKASGTDMDFSWTAIDPLVILDAKGDLITATAADTPARLAVGTNAQVLTADSSTATGLKWATASSGALTLIKRASFSAVSTTTTSFDSSFNSTYKVFVVVCEKIQGSNGATLYLQTRSAASTQNTAYYGASYGYDNTATVRTAASNNAAQFSLFQIESGRDSNFSLNFNNVGNTTEAPSWYGLGFSTWQSAGFAMGAKRDSAASNVDGFILSASTGTITGTVAVYGLATA
jgi:hypothetical protein